MSASLAVFVTVSTVCSANVRVLCAGNTGALFTSFTVTTKLLVALNGGTPLSVTTVIIVFVPGPSASFGVKVMKPLASIFVLAGGDTNCYVNLLAGLSAALVGLVASRV